LIGTKMTVFIVAMSTVLSVTPIAAPIAASAQCETLGDSDTTAQGNNAIPVQNADELLDDDDEGGNGENAQSANNGATASDSEFQPSDTRLSNSNADNDINTIVALNTGVANCNAQTGAAPQSNGLTGLAVNDFDATIDAFGG
jgi:hypothetical protein